MIFVHLVCLIVSLRLSPHLIDLPLVLPEDLNSASWLFKLHLIGIVDLLHEFKMLHGDIIEILLRMRQIVLDTLYPQ